MTQQSALEAAEADRVYARRLVQAYFAMLTLGCQDSRCGNALCRSSTKTPAPSAADAVIRSVYLATQAPVPVCEALGAFVLLEPPTSEPAEARETMEDTVASQPETPDVHSVDKQSESEGEKAAAGASEATPRCSTPRRRLSTAVQLDLGLNTPPKAVIKHIAVQPKHTAAPRANNVSAGSTSTLGAAAEPLQATITASKAGQKSPRRGRLSRPKQKLLDAIKKSFSRARKTPLGST